MSSRSPSHDHDPDTRPYTYRRPSNLDPDLFTSQEDVADSLPSPPYRRVPSTSHVLLESYPEQTPAYRSRSNVTLAQGATLMASSEPQLDEKQRVLNGHDHAYGAKGKHPVQVHYEDAVDPPSHRFEPDFAPPSRPASIAGTDDEDEEEDYDWSGEEDLVDEEAKFEHAMGVKKKERKFGCVKYVAICCCVPGCTPPSSVFVLTRHFAFCCAA